MVQDFFGLREKPFSLVPDPRFLYLGKAQREALDRILEAIEGGAGLIEVVGPVGIGKTMLCRAVIERVVPDCEVAYVFNPSPSAEELISAINREFRLPTIAAQPADLVDELHRFLVEQKAAQRRALLVIDEAQNLDPEVLEQIGLLSGLGSEALIQILLFGQPELDENLARTGIQELRQRIALRRELAVIPLPELRPYLEHRLRAAGSADGELFSAPAIRALHRVSGGVPRVINAVAGRSMLAAYAAGKRPVTRACVRRAARELASSERRGGVAALGLTQRAALVALFLGALVGGGVAAWNGISQLEGPSRVSRSPAAAPGALATPPVGSAGRSASAETAQAERSAAHAVDALLEVWGYPPLGLVGIDSAEIPALVENSTPLRVLDARATLDQLERLDLPAVLEIRDGGNGSSFQVLVGITSDGRLQLRGEAGSRLLRRAELLREWNGHTLWFWTNFEAVPELAPGATGGWVDWLQRRLRELGDPGPARENHEFDAATAAAVMRLQSRYGLNETGVLDQATLLALYQALGFGSPRIAMGGEVS